MKIRNRPVLSIAVLVAVFVAALMVRDYRSTAATSGWQGTRMPSVAFVVTCKLSHKLKDDPILLPNNSGASHQHGFFGNTSTNANSTGQSMRLASTSCDEPKDRAAYWAPVPMGNYLRAYYDRGAGDSKTISAFLSGAQSIAGSADVVTPGVESVAFRCGAVADGPDASGWVEAPINTCASTGREPVVRYTFGQCGRERLLPCGSRDAARYVRLRLVMPWVGVGRMPGLGPHADFWNTWDQRRLEQLVAICVRGERKSNLEIKQCRLNGVGPAHS
jgi:Domain of unknown function (DUF1996)